MGRWWYKIADKSRDAVDYQGTKWFVPAGEKNFTKSANQREIRHIVIHITGGPKMNESSSVNEFRSSSKSSAHYIVNRHGVITQMVRENDIAHHAHSGNKNSIGIEHVNPFTGRKKKRPTKKQYEASADLVAYLCWKYNIPTIRSHSVGHNGIIGHMDVDPNTGHNCPTSKAWDWDRYLKLVRQAYNKRITEACDRYVAPILPYGNEICKKLKRHLE